MDAQEPQRSHAEGEQGLTAPSISLPKGGGAIRGIGEKFAANPVTGTGSIVVPIATSPGRSGFGPALALGYDSGTGNGPFGFGWALSLPAITRKTDGELPQYRDAEESDVFILSGAEDLVPDAGHAADTSVAGFTIHRYRPRIEGLFARIERWTRQSDGDVHWRAISRDNMLTLYGKDAHSRICDPTDPGRIFSWLICETRDDRGNAVLYDYKPEDGTGVDRASAHERNRGDGNDARRTANRYLKRVRYGNRAPLLDNTGERPSFLTAEQIAAAGWLFEAVFDYGEHAEATPTPAETAPWTYRDDPFSSYRSGFEVRTCRLCRRVLMFHHFAQETGVGSDCLVRSTDFTYADQHYMFLTTVTQSGYKRQGGGYEQRSLPPLAFEYSQPIVQESVQTVDAQSLENLPVGLDAHAYHWTDLHGEGIPGILTEQAGAWFYKRNLSPVSEGPAAFAPLEQVALAPNRSLSGGQAQFIDLAGDGQPDLVVLDGPMPGLYEHDDDEGWQPFRAFTSPLTRHLRDPNVRLVDLDGDGHADVLITEADQLVWHPSLAEAGFGPARRLSQALDEEKGPRLVLADGAQSIYLADMSGDGLTDLVRIRNGEVCYWPNLGYGRFGARVAMDRAPWFDAPDQFDQQRIRVADIDGSGTTDIIYLHGDGVRLYFNQSGNGWSAAQPLRTFPQVDNLAAIDAVDLLGNGTACLVWSSPLPVDAGRQMRYVDLMGGQKPHLLVRVVNNLGAETQIRYAPSTRFYLADKLAGKPWLTRLPFPVHVVEQIERSDQISRTRFVTRYAYHHGYFDGEEREFRGFGMVEQWDTEAYADGAGGELDQPPVTTRTWHHTGAFLARDRLLHQFQDEYYRQERYLPEPLLPAGLDDAELLECMRALKGLPLRQEVYSFDGSAQQQHPYHVLENSFELRRLQPLGGQKHAVFFAVGRESVSLNYERNPADPRISHSLQLETDEYGNVLKGCAVVYGRQIADPLLPAEVTRDQQKRYITYTETAYTPDIDRAAPTPAYRTRVPHESISFEITGVAPAAAFFQFDEIRTQIAGAAAIAYETVAGGPGAEKRPLSHGRTLFLDNSLNPLPAGQWDSLSLIHQSYKLAFTPGVTGSAYAGNVTDAEFTAAGYIHLDGDANWWIPSGTAIYPPDPSAHFYMPIGVRDPLGVETLSTRDAYDLLVERVQVKQATWNESTAVNDYRILGPVVLTDPNKNRSAVETDALGMVVKSAVMGKAESADGDTLADPTVRMEYALFNWMDHGKPNFVRSFAREQHGAANPRWQESYAYLDGQGSVTMVKGQAHPGKALTVNPDGTVAEVDADPRWVGNGRMIFNNKGNPVKQYEPYFSTTHDYEDEDGLREIGVTAILYYDALGRNIRTLFPNGTFAKVRFDPWMQSVFDANDTVRESEWYASRGSPDPTAEPEPLGDPERRAAWLAAKHADTPGAVHFDSLGRPIYAIADYGGGKRAAVRSETDLTGRHSRLFDQQGREVASGFTGMAGTPMMGASAEKGRRWTFQNVAGALVKTWDEHGRQFRTEYDVMRRPVSLFLQEVGQPELLFNHVVYGDRHPDAEQLNLLGVAHQIFDQAGMVRVPEIDFKGNPRRVERVLAREYSDYVQWNPLAGQPDYAAIQSSADALLEVGELFTASAEHDALNRPTRVTMPDGTVIVPTYNEANFLTSLQAQIRGQGGFLEFLKGQDYDARGQRQFAHHGNETFTRYFYDPSTFRLVSLLTYRSGEPDSRALQHLHYTYDPLGNVTQIRDDAQQTHYFNNAVVRPESLFEYDALYQLVRATGREHASALNNAIRTHTDLDFVPHLPHPNDPAAVRTYTEAYEYDLLGNISLVRHQAGAGAGWTRRYRYAYEDDPANRTNRLVATSLPGDADAGPYTGTYDYDAYGNMTRMPHLAQMDWTFMDQLRQVDLGGGGTAHYVYGQGGQRIRKVIERNGNAMLEWIFLGPVMIFRRRRRDTKALRFERWTVHISDNTGPIAQVDVKTRDDDGSDSANPLNTPLIRYQYANHLGSAVLETDQDGNPIAYEEFHPYGTTAYRSAKPGFDVSLKRYRFSGKERDEETGLYYFGARYYAPWLGRWTSSDPAGFVSGPNLYRYCRNSPTVFHDPNGMDENAGVVNIEPDSPLQALRDPSKAAEARTYLEGVYTSRLRDQTKRLVIDEMNFVNEERRWNISRWHLAPRESGGDADSADDGAGSEGDGPGAGAAGTGPGGGGTGSGEGGTGSGDGGTGTGSGSGESGSGSGEGGTTPEATPPPEPPPTGVARPTGQSAVTTWDSIQRGEYVRGNTRGSRAAQDAIEAARREGDVARAWQEAEEVSAARNARRLGTQGRLSPGGRAMSEAIEGARDFGSMVETYSGRLPGVEGGTRIPTGDRGEIARRIAVAAGESRPAIKTLARVGRVAGPVGLAVGIGLGIKAIWDAPEGQKGRVAAREIGSFVGGAIGASVGMSAGVALAGGISGFLMGLGLAAGPIGWLAIGLGLLGALAVGYWFSHRGSQAGEALYDAAY